MLGWLWHPVGTYKARAEMELTGMRESDEPIVATMDGTT
jgi:hypothetical protein